MTIAPYLGAVIQLVMRAGIEPAGMLICVLGQAPRLFFGLLVRY